MTRRSFIGKVMVAAAAMLGGTAIPRETAQAAEGWRDRFVSSAAKGGGDGSAERPWTLAEAVRNCKSDGSSAHGIRINAAAGTYIRDCTFNDRAG